MLTVTGNCLVKKITSKTINFLDSATKLTTAMTTQRRTDAVTDGSH